MKKWICLILSFMLFSCEKKPKELIRPVVVKTIQKSPEEIDYEYLGVVIPKKESSIAFRVSGPVKKMDLNIGDYVKEGDLISKIDDRDYIVQLEMAEKKVSAAKNMYLVATAISENANLQFKRVKKLYYEKAISKKIYEETLSKMKAAASSELASLSQYEAALEGVKNAKNQLSDTTLVSPFSGYISKIYFDEGSVIGAGIPIVTLSSQDKNRVKINVSDLDLDKIEKMKKAEFLIGEKKFMLKKLVASRVKGINEVAYPVIFNFLEENVLTSDLEGIVKITLENDIKGRNLIPLEAIFGDKEKMYVWVLKDGKVMKKEIKNIQVYDLKNVLGEGVLEGERVVTKGVNELSEGQSVKEVTEVM
ncbi:efflux RND transporter periplasmic adaptor subunit [Cetobacterium sp.]|uniref:efflux RND transporter periplasmic adaptor subunit n=1 Tax=Cetobacterium sp. TaxID=2071632 RepID=UPI002FC8B91A